MTSLEALILGIVQGITEFFPVSSSGHLKLFQHLLGFQNLDSYILFDLICHLGTLLALVIVLYKPIQTAFTSDRTRFFQIVLATLPLFPLLLIMKPIKSLFNQPQNLGYFFLFTALLLYLGIQRKIVSEQVLYRNRWRDPLVIGLFQAVAILPGISRSGSTISAGRFLGWQPQEAAVFSFLLAIPTILGAIVIEGYNLFKSSIELPSISFSSYFIGFAVSFGVGYAALSLVMKLASKNKFIYFVWYCILIGIFTILYFNF